MFVGTRSSHLVVEDADEPRVRNRRVIPRSRISSRRRLGLERCGTPIDEWRIESAIAAASRSEGANRPNIDVMRRRRDGSACQIARPLRLLTSLRGGNQR